MLLAGEGCVLRYARLTGFCVDLYWLLCFGIFTCLFSQSDALTRDGSCNLIVIANKFTNSCSFCMWDRKVGGIRQVWSAAQWFRVVSFISYSAAIGVLIV